MKFLSRKDFNHKQLSSPKSGEEFSLSAVLSKALDSQQFFIHHEILAPGKRTSSPHYHEHTEEFVYIIAGKVTASEGDESVEMNTGDCAVFTANSTMLHCLENRSSENAELLVISQKLTQPDAKFS